jgi:hypothetical protein
MIKDERICDNWTRENMQWLGKRRHAIAGEEKICEGLEKGAAQTLDSCS